MRNFQIYLAGAMLHKTFEEMYGWRSDLKCRLGDPYDWYNVNVHVINPCDYYCFDNPVHQSEREVMEYDLARVRESDIIIVNLDGLMSSVGTIMELHEAYRCGIPVIALDKNDERNNLHSWLKCCITRYESDVDSLYDYIGDFYFSLGD